MTVFPHALFVRFLVTKGLDTLEKVNAALAEENLAACTEALFKKESELVFSQVSRPVALQIAKQAFSAGFDREMKVLGVWDLWRGEKLFLLPEKDPYRGVVKLARDINQDPQVRVTVNALLMKGVPHPDIAQTVNLRFATLLNENHVSFYERFFFAWRQMTRTSWKAFLKVCEPEERGVYFTALTEPLDTLKTQLQLPAKHSTSEVLQYLLTKSTQNAKALLENKSPSGRAEAMKWIDTVLRITDKFEKYRSGDQADLANSLQMEFDWQETVFPAPDDDVLKEHAEKLKKTPEQLEAERALLPES